MGIDRNTFNRKLQELLESAKKREKKEIERVIIGLIPTYKKDMNLTKKVHKRKWSIIDYTFQNIRIRDC